MLIDDVAQEGETLLAEFAFLWVQRCTSFLDLLRAL